jgi:hypothetical protein
MDPTENDSVNQENFDSAATSASQTPIPGRSPSQSLIARTASTVATLAIFALPVSLALSSKNYIYGKIPFLKQLGLRPGSTKSAVLAVDVNGLTIQSRSASEEAIDKFEKAAMAQLANLHRTYSAWAENHEDLSGTLLVKLRVDKLGKVSQVDPLAARLSSAIFTRVVLSEIRRWSFPAGAAEPVEITMPLLFVPKGLDTSTVVDWERRTRAAGPVETAAHGAGPGGTPTTAAPRSSPAAKALSGDPSREILAPVTAVKPTKPEPAEPRLAVLRTTQAVGLRLTPRYSSPRVYEVDADTELSLLESQGDWLKVQVANSEPAGFVRKEFLRPLD